jgi:hypothetical protein
MFESVVDSLAACCALFHCDWRFLVPHCRQPCCARTSCGSPSNCQLARSRRSNRSNSCRSLLSFLHCDCRFLAPRCKKGTLLLALTTRALPPLRSRMPSDKPKRQAQATALLPAATALTRRERVLSTALQPLPTCCRCCCQLRLARLDGCDGDSNMYLGRTALARNASGSPDALGRLARKMLCFAYHRVTVARPPRTGRVRRAAARAAARSGLLAARSAGLGVLSSQLARCACDSAPCASARAQAGSPASSTVASGWGTWCTV